MALSRGDDGLTNYLVPLAIRTANRWIDSLIAGPGECELNATPGAVVLLDPRALSSEWGDSFLAGLNVGQTIRLPFRNLMTELQRIGKQSG